MNGGAVASSGEQFDPRFDPAFQRGYEGPALSRPVADLGPGPAEQGRIVEPPRAHEPIAALPPESPAHQLPSLQGNPWVRALWVAAGGLTVAGAGAQVWAAQLYAASTSTSAAIQYVLPTLLSGVSPWLLGAGLASGVATMVLHAVRWRASE